MATVALGRSGAWATWKFGNWDWQVEAWRLYDIVGELRFLAGWIGDSVSQARMYVTRLDETGEETGEVIDPSIARLAAVPLGGGAQRDDNLRLLGIDLAVAGEAWIVGEGAASGDPKGWFVVSGGQLRREAGWISVTRPIQFGGGILRLTDGQDLLIRAWRPHPNDILQSDSPTRSAIPPLREIELLTKREFAELESRLTGAGVWLLPEGIDFPKDEGDPEDISGFMASMQRIAALNIRDQSSASALVPIMATVPDQWVEHIDKFKPITFWSDLSEQIMPMKEKAIIRVGATFEVPSEILTGIGDSNHWTSWAISEEGIKRIKPYLATIADTLTRGFLVPTLERAGIPNAEEYAYVFDVAPLSVRPNRLPEALDLSDRYLLKDLDTVQAGAFTAEQMPDDAEKLRMLLFRSVAKDPTLLTDPGIQAALGITGVPARVIAPAPAPAEEPPAEDAPADGPPDNLDDGPTDGDPPGPATNAALSARLARMIESHQQPARALTACAEGEEDVRALRTATKLLVLRALELAGGRLTTPADRTRRWAETPRHELHTRIGPITPDRATKVLDGACEHVGAVAEELAMDPDQLRAGVFGYCHELITRGIPHADDMLDAAVIRMRRAA